MDGVVLLRGGGKKDPMRPYVVDSQTGRIYGGFKLFEDTSNAFVRGTIPRFGAGRYKWFTGFNVHAFFTIKTSSHRM